MDGAPGLTALGMPVNSTSTSISALVAKLSVVEKQSANRWSFRHQQRQATSEFLSLGFSREIGSQTKVRCSSEIIHLSTEK